LPFNGFCLPSRYRGRFRATIPITSLTRAKNGDWFAHDAVQTGEDASRAVENAGLESKSFY
jgi:hypothetical protein